MINQVNSQPMISCPQMNMPKQEAKNLIISSSLMMMLLEWASKQGDNDIALHQALENMMSFNDGVNPLKIDCFEVIVPETVKAEPSEVPEDLSDIEGGECVKAFTDGFNLANQEECEVLPCLDTQDECCASKIDACLANNEAESFWDGYESVEPQKIEYYGEEPVSIKQPIVQKDENEISDDLQSEIDRIINLSAGM